MELLRASNRVVLDCQEHSGA